MLTVYTLNNLGETTKSETYADASYSSGIVYNADYLRARTVTKYDNRGNVYETDTYCVTVDSSVDPNGIGTVTDHLPTDTWYDPNGNAFKTQTGTTGSFQKFAYDGMGDLTVSYVGYENSPETDSDLYSADGQAQLDLANDAILQQTQTWYNAAGEQVATAVYQQYADGGSPGAGPLDEGESNASYSYATASVSFYDGIGRDVQDVNLGREDVNAGADSAHYFFDGASGNLFVAMTDPGVPYAADNPGEFPSSSANYIVSQTAYNSAGLPYLTTDNAGHATETLYDAAGRTVRTIQNFDGLAYGAAGSGFDSSGNVLAADTATDITVDYQYDSAGRLSAMVAYDANGTTVVAETTQYLYASPVNASWQTGVIYPDGGSDATSTAYDWLGRVTSTTDQRGVVHTYIYDTAGRLSLDDVTSLGPSGIVDGAVLSIGTTYDDLSRVRTVTSYSGDDGSGTIVNEVEDAYDGWGNLVEEWQSHSGAVDTGSTPSVQYTYDDGAVDGVAAYLRLTDVIYPNGQDVHYNYGNPSTDAVDYIMSRLSSISDSQSSQTDAQYTYPRPRHDHQRRLHPGRLQPDLRSEWQ